MSTTTTTTDLVPVALALRAQAVAIAAKGDVKGALALLAPPSALPAVAAKPDLPKPFALSASRRAALLNAVDFLETRAVTTDAVRLLADDEKASLIEERELLDHLEALVKERKASIRAMTFNHLDRELEESGRIEIPRDDAGHYLVPGFVTTDGAEKKLTREISAGSPVLTAAALEEVAADLEIPELVHEDYLACTDQVRVINENKLALRMAQRPEIVEGIRRALTPAKATASHSARKK